MSTEKTYHLIDDYLSGRLFGRELDKFKAQLKADTKLQEQVALQEAIISEIEVSRKAELKAYLNENKTQRGIQFIPNIASAMGAAALIVMLVAAYFIIDFVVDKRTNQIVKENKPKTTLPDTNTEESTYAFDSLNNDSQRLAITTIPENNGEEPELMEDTEIPIPEINSEGDNEYDEVENDKGESALGKVDVASDEEIEVKKDVLLANKKYTVRSLNTIEPVQTTTIETTSTRKPATQKAKEDSFDDATQAEKFEPAAPEVAKPAAKNINVEYWQSVVNYKGYNYDGKNLKLYGVNQTKPIEFKELDNRVYLKMDNKQFYLEKNSSYNRLTELTNPTLLNILND